MLFDSPVFVILTVSWWVMYSTFMSLKFSGVTLPEEGVKSKLQF